MRTLAATALLLVCGCEALGVADVQVNTADDLYSPPQDPLPPATVPPPQTLPDAASPPPPVDAGTIADAGEADASVPDAGPADAGPPDAGPFDAGPPAVLTNPRLGQLFDGDVTQITLSIEGVSSWPNDTISIQALNADGGWTQVAAAQSAPSLSAGAYPFQVDWTPGTDWLQGGTYSLRAHDSYGRALKILDYDADDCAANHPGQSWLQLPCASPFDRATLVSSGPGPADQSPPPPYLTKKGVLTPQDTADYYAAINAPATLGDYRALYGFDQGTEAIAVYFNQSDLGIGREMHCVALSPGLACYVRNYGVFGGTALDAIAAAVLGAALDGNGSFAAVAMAYQPNTAEPITFIVYGADGSLSTSAQLDTRGDNTSIPNNCLSCHGLKSSYDPNTHHVSDASFLAFNPGGFGYNLSAPFRLVDELGQLQVLNQWVRGAGASPLQSELILDDYLAATVLGDGTLAPPSAVPQGWAAPADARIWKEVVGPNCSGCHSTFGQSAGLSFSDAASFTAEKTQISQRVCGTPGDTNSHDMPNAEVPLKQLWSSRARAYLVAYLGLSNPCAP